MGELYANSGNHNDGVKFGVACYVCYSHFALVVLMMG